MYVSQGLAWRHKENIYKIKGFMWSKYRFVIGQARRSAKENIMK